MDQTLEIGLNQQGEVTSLCRQGKEFVSSQTTTVFQVQLRDMIGNPVRLAGNSFGQVTVQKTADGYIWHFAECSRFPGAYADASVRIDGAESRWNLTFVPGKTGYTVEWIDFPRIRFKSSGGGKWLLPNAEGMMLESLPEREKTGFRCGFAEYPLTGVSSFYPGPAAMQFEAYLTPDACLYIGCQDTEHFPKTIDFLPDGPDAFCPVLQHFTGGGNSIAYETVIRAFQGDWTDAAEIYRSWMEANDPCLPPKLPASGTWLNDSPVLLIYPVKGRGMDAHALETNEYFPYDRALPMIEGYRKELHSRILALLMHWEGTAPWAPPYIWPPYGGQSLLKTFIDEMHGAGDLVGLYGSGIGWTQQSMIDPRYNREENFIKNGVKNEICTGPRGEAYSRVCNGPNGQRLGYDLCPGRDFTSDTVAQEIRSASALGVDYLQYFDQNQGCTSPLCYSKEHGHPAFPGAWQTQAMRSLLDKAQEAAGATLIGCENAAAEPYMKVCRLNDMRSHLAWGAGGVPVPLYQYLFHEYAAGFTGNGVCLGYWIDYAKTPFFLQYHLAWNFTAGNLLAVVLKNAGKIHWNWVLPWDEPEPEQTPLKTLIRNLNAWRQGAAADYLISGRMEMKPPVRCGRRTIFCRNGRKVAVPAVESSAWSNGVSRALILVNYNATAEKCTVVFGQDTHGTVVTHKTQTEFQASELELEVPPLDMILLKMANNRTWFVKVESEEIRPKKPFTCLAIGNSLTLHGKCSYWWDDRRGMASSEPEKDFVHRVAAHLKTMHDDVAFSAFNFAAWEVQAKDRAETLPMLEKYFAVPPDLITLQLGENVSDMSTISEDFEELLQWLKAHAPAAKIIVIGNFFPSDAMDQCKRDAAKKYGCAFADLSPFAGKKEYMCPVGTLVKDDLGMDHRVEHKGVAAHPGDAGMEAIAAKIIE